MKIASLNVSVDCVVFGFAKNKLKVLLIKQKQFDENVEPMWALPGDLVKGEECFDTAADRVLEELTGLKDLYLKQFYAFGDPNRVRQTKDQPWLQRFREHPYERVATIGYFSLVRMEDYAAAPSSFASETHWWDVNKVPELAFDHNQVFDRGFAALQEDLSKENPAAELLPRKFTLSQLQLLHEQIMRTTLDKRNFRKTLKRNEDLVALDEKEKNVDHKPAQLYTFLSD